MRRSARAHAGTSLPEVVAVLALTGILLALAIPRLRDVLERGAVRAAVADLVTTLSAARQIAASRGGASVAIDSAAAAVYVIRRGDTLVARRLGRAFGVSLR